MMRRVVITGMAGLCPLGSHWDEVKPKLLAKTSAIAVQPGWDTIQGLRTRLERLSQIFSARRIIHARRCGPWDESRC